MSPRRLFRHQVPSRSLLSFRLISVLVGFGLVAVVPAGFAVAAPTETPPQLSIAVDDGLTTAVAGDKLAYTLTVTNLGTERVRDLLVTQTVPAGSTLVSKDSGGKESAGTVTWKVDLDATKVKTFSLSLEVDSTPDEVLRLATVACARLTTKSPPLVCASDSNQLPAGAAADAEQAKAAEADASWLPPNYGVFVAGGVAVLAVAGVFLFRSKRPATARRAASAPAVAQGPDPHAP